MFQYLVSDVAVHTVAMSRGNVLTKWRLVIAALVLLGTATGAALTPAATKTFRATATVDVSQYQALSSQQCAGYGFRRVPVSGYRALATATYVSANAVALNELPISPARLVGSISTTVDSAGHWVQIHVTSRNAMNAVRYANVVARVYAGFLSSDTCGPVPGTVPTLHIPPIAKASHALPPHGAPWLRNLSVGALAGLVLGLTLTLVRARQARIRAGSREPSTD
jgi:capsular polysaccharide biosynthesis protein